MFWHQHLGTVAGDLVNVKFYMFWQSEFGRVADDLGNVKFDTFWQSAFGGGYRRHECDPCFGPHVWY